MKLSINNTKFSNLLQPSQQIQPINKSGDVKFSDFLSKDSFDAVKEIKQKLFSGQEISTRELLTYQLKAQDVHFKVELISKVAETALASAKKLQQG